jgi:hypothetical protein
LLEKRGDNSLGFFIIAAVLRLGTGIAKEPFRNPFDSRRDSHKTRRLYPDKKQNEASIKEL